jgi:holo-[acyl-carrier protein] synthase
MKIFGVGIDIVKINRIKKTLKSKKNFKKRIFTNREINFCEKKKSGKINCYSKRFAAKEAFSKALGTGISGGLNFNEIETFSEKNGKPGLKIIGKSLSVLKKVIKKKNYKLFLSLSDEKSCAVAFVIITL